MARKIASVRPVKRTPMATQKGQKQVQAQAAAQFASLGQFVQAFETVADTIRRHCIDMTMGFQRGITVQDNKPNTLIAHHRICSAIFHYDAFTAGPMITLWRAILMEQIKVTTKLSDKGAEIVTAIAAQINSEFNGPNGLIRKRNALMHATWGIGQWPFYEDIETVVVQKFKVTKSGIEELGDLPKSLDDLSALTTKTYDIWGLIGRLIQYLRYDPEQISIVFKKENKKWIFVPPTKLGGCNAS